MNLVDRKFGNRRAQGGVVLIVAMVMLVIIGLMSVSVMRGALNADLVANNARSQTSAMQAAQIALRYCERNSDPSKVGPVTILDAPADDDGNLHTPGPTNWNNFANWFGSSPKRFQLTGDIMKSDGSSFVPDHMPECMVEKTTLEDGVTPAFIITARGFSPDYQQDDAGKATAGSVVWVQSTIGRS